MRTLPFVILGAIVAAAATTALPAAHTSALDTPRRGSFRVAALRDNAPCDIWRTVEHIARFSGIRVGFEHAAACAPRGWSRRPEADAIVMDGWTPRQALDYVVTQRPEFAWREIDGVAVMRPLTAWVDAGHVLHRPVAAFAVREQHPHLVLHALAAAALPSLYREHEDLRLSPTHAGRVDSPTEIDRPVDVAFDGGTMLAALNAVALRVAANWELGYWGRPHVALYAPDFDSGLTGMSLDLEIPKPTGAP